MENRICAKERTMQRQSARGKSLSCVKGDSPQCGEMSRSDRGARRVSGCPAGAEGLWPCEGSSMYGQGHNPPPPIGGAPFTQGGLFSTAINWRLPGAGPLCGMAALVVRRQARAIGSSGHLFRFLFGCPKRKDSRKYDARQARAKSKNQIAPLAPPMVPYD